MENYWNKRFIKEKLVWGIKPGNVAIESEKIFKKNDAKNILVMGIGYGRNGKIFVEHGYNVDGVEYSEEAIALGKIFCPRINFINGSVLDIDLNKKYDGIFCYSILHLFQGSDRDKLIGNCIRHCNEHGIIVISCCSTKDKTYGIGNKIEENTYEIKQGKIMHFYNEKEMLNISPKLKTLKIGYKKERIETNERKEEYNMIYGMYKVKK